MSKQPPNFKQFEDAPESAPPIDTHKAKNGNGKISAISKPQKTRRKGKMDAIQLNEQALSQVENAADYKGIESIEIDGINHTIQQNQALGTIDLSQAIDPATTPPDNVDNQAPSIEERPCFKCHLDFWQDHHGKTQRAGVWYHSLSKGEEPHPIDTWICGEILVEAIARDTTGRSFGQVLRFKNRLGEWQTWNMPTRLMAGRGEELLRELMDMGLGFNYYKRNQIAAYICSVNPTQTVWTASQVGWFDTENFVLPDATIGKDSDGILFQTESNNHQEYNTAGTLADWRDNVAALCMGNPILLFTVSTAFAGALLKPCNMDGVGFHIFGDSSKGKTTGLKLAASVWGNWEKYKRVWKSTANGLEGAAALFNDGLLTLDEIGDSEAKELADSLYLLGNGTGKQRANVSGHAKAVKTWRIAILSNGEKTIEAHLSEKGLTVKAGQLIRFLQIPLFGQYGAFDELHSYEGGGALAGAIVKQANQAYGVAGREYLNKLTQDPNTLEQCPQHLDAALKRFTARFGELSAQEARAAKSFALVGLAGELATQYGVTGWANGAAIESALTCFEYWRGYRGQGDTEGLQIIESVSAYLEKYGDARFSSTTEKIILHGERSGYWRDSFSGREWLLTKSGLQQAAKGYDLKQVVKVLKNAGWLIPDSEGKSGTKVNFKGNETGERRLYVIKVTDDSCQAPKQDGSSGTGGTDNGDSSTCSANEETGWNSISHVDTGSSTNSTFSTTKTDNTNKVRDRGAI